MTAGAPSHQGPDRHRVARGRLTAAVLAGLGAGLGSLALAAPAAAHDVLVDSSPGDGEVLDQAPGEVVLEFNNSPLDVNPQVELRDGVGEVLATGAPVLDGTRVTADVEADLGDGTYTVLWAVTSSDGHPIDGEFSFELVGVLAGTDRDDEADDDGAEGADEGLEGADDGAAADQGDGAGDDGAEDDAGRDDDGDSTPDDGDGADPDLWEPDDSFTWLFSGLAVVALGVVWILWATRQSINGAG